MFSKSLKVVVGVTLVLVGGAAIVVMRIDNTRLRRRIADTQAQGKQAARLRDDNRKTQELLARLKVDEGDGARAIHVEAERARAEVAELEQAAQAAYAQTRAQTAADATALAGNRDPEKGLMRLENFKNQGQATPAAAFQTFGWAAMKGEDAVLAGLIAFTGAAREQAEAVVAALPEAARAKYPTPEKLAALFFADALTATAAAEIVGVALPDGSHAVVTVRGLTDREQKLPMLLGPQGWQIVVPEGMVGNLAGWARGGPKAPTASK